MTYEYYTEYSFEKEHEEKCFNIIETLAQKFPMIHTRTQSNAHDFWPYKSIVIEYALDYDEHTEDEGEDYESPWLDEANELEKLIQTNEEIKNYL